VRHADTDHERVRTANGSDSAPCPLPDAPSANEVAQVNAAFAVEAAEVEYAV